MNKCTSKQPFEYIKASPMIAMAAPILKFMSEPLPEGKLVLLVGLAVGLFALSVVVAVSGIKRFFNDIQNENDQEMSTSEQLDSDGWFFRQGMEEAISISKTKSAGVITIGPDDVVRQARLNADGKVERFSANSRYYPGEIIEDVIFDANADAISKGGYDSQI